MAGKIVIDTERCKGCGLCVSVCPQKSLAISKKSNKSGYFPAKKTDSQCSGCAMCAVICPETIIEVYREDNTDEETKKRKKSKRTLVKGKGERTDFNVWQ